MNEEKKLTDEEIVKNLISYKNAAEIDGFIQITSKQMSIWVDLIYRLHRENKRLKDEFKTYYRNSWKNKFFGVLEENQELQKQVDELTERYLEESKERCEYEQKYKKIQHTHNIGLGAQRSHWEKKVEQAVKDTAKEICDLILEHWENKQFVECDWLRVVIAEKYGVEVE